MGNLQPVTNFAQKDKGTGGRIGSSYKNVENRVLRCEWAYIFNAQTK